MSGGANLSVVASRPSITACMYSIGATVLHVGCKAGSKATSLYLKVKSCKQKMAGPVCAADIQER